MRGSDSGLTLVELLVAMALFLVALLMFSGSLWTVQRMQRIDDEYSRQNDAALLAFQSIDRQVRSGYVAGTGAITGADEGVRIYTEAGGKPQCVMWVLATPVAGGPQGLYTTSWWPLDSTATYKTAPTSFSATSTGVWRQVVGDVWNKLLSKTALTSLSASGGILASLQVDLWVNDATVQAVWWTDTVKYAAFLDRAKRQAVEVSSYFTSRNAPRSGENPFGATGTTLPTKGGTLGICGV